MMIMVDVNKEDGMKPHRSVSMIILDAVLILWWIIFVIMFFTVLVRINRPTGIYGFYAKGLVVVYNLLISEGEWKLRSELDVGKICDQYFATVSGCNGLSRGEIVIPNYKNDLYD